LDLGTVQMYVLNNYINYLKENGNYVHQLLMARSAISNGLKEVGFALSTLNLKMEANVTSEKL
jgi:hypothetical protein